MDPALEQTLSALGDPLRFDFGRQRPAPGEEPRERELFIGVGARDAASPPHPRMLSWKLPQWRRIGLRATCATVIASAEALDALETPARIRLHEATLDCTLATFLAAHRLLHRRWPEAFAPLVDYVSDWEQGRTERAGAYDRALASVFYASMQLYAHEGAGPAPQLLELVAGALDARLDGAGLAALPEALIPRRVARRLKADADLYRTELSRAWQVQLDLPIDNQPRPTYRRIDALFLSSPQDVTVLKLLARPDTERSSYGRGFELLAIHAPNEPQAWARHTISIAPESSGTLADLALVLDRLEGDLTPDGQPRARGTPRFAAQPAELGGLSDPWYSDAYARERERSTLVAPPFVGTRLSREALWEAVWERFNVGHHVAVSASRTVYLKPFRATGEVTPEGLLASGWARSDFSRAAEGLLPSVASSFFAGDDGADVLHFEKTAAVGALHLSLYANGVVLVWVEQTHGPSTLFEVASRQAALALGDDFEALPELHALRPRLEPLSRQRWFVYGAYRIDRARSTMLDDSRSVRGLLHALASGQAPDLRHLPSEAAIAARRVHARGDEEHWFTATGGARLELNLEAYEAPPPLDGDFALFLLTSGQRYAAFEITRRMGEVERASRTRRWQSHAPTRALRGDVMLFINSLWHARVSDDPDVDARYDAWRELHDMQETVEALRSQTTELDQYRREGFENMVGVLLFLFLPITIVSGFFSGVQFEDLSLRQGIPWSTGGWRLFLLYTAFFSVLVYGAVLASRLFSRRRR